MSGTNEEGKNFEYYLNKSKEYGVVKEIAHPIVYCTGLPSIKTQEQVIFESGHRGQVVSILEDKVEIVTFSRMPVKPGDKVTSIGKYLAIPVGDQLLGTVIDPVSNLLFEKEGYEIPTEVRDYEAVPPNISHRIKIKRPLYSGVSIVDVMMPLGKGQRELVVGDRQIGKTSAVVNLIKKQVEEGAVIVYALIGKEKSEIKRIKTLFEEEGLLENSVVVATSSDDPPSFIDLCPYSAMTIAEYFRENGRDVLVALDDLTTHAKYYRELALLAKKFPGRDSYPGDIFYKHARLLERAGNFEHEDDGESAITCLAFAETVDGSLTDYIVSNLISITDGHLHFNSEAFNKGRRPSIDVFLSVTRAGKQTQHHIVRTLNRRLFMMLSKHVDAENFQHFGAELGPETKQLLVRGDHVYQFFIQKSSTVIPLEVQTAMLTMIQIGLFDDTSVEDLSKRKSKFIDQFNDNEDVKNKLTDLMSGEDYDEYEKKIQDSSEYLLEICKITN